MFGFWWSGWQDSNLRPPAPKAGAIPGYATPRKYSVLKCKYSVFKSTAKILFLKNSEVKDNFKAKGLQEAGEVLDIMRLDKEDEYGYNRYLDSLHLKASEIFSLQTEAEFKVEERKTFEIAKNAIIEGFDNDSIKKITKLAIEKIVELRSELKK